MFDKPYQAVLDAWIAEYLAWKDGSHSDLQPGGLTDDPELREKYSGRPPAETFFDWHGGPPDPDYYRPDWPAETRTHIQMYETCSEGTPISPVMETPEALAHWLSDNEASAFGHMTATYEQWLATIKQGWAPSMVMAGSAMCSGVEFVAATKEQR